MAVGRPAFRTSAATSDVALSGNDATTDASASARSLID
jgi:hypothetical protein